MLLCAGRSRHRRGHFQVRSWVARQGRKPVLRASPEGRHRFSIVEKTEGQMLENTPTISTIRTHSSVEGGRAEQGPRTGVMLPPRDGPNVSYRLYA